MYYDLRNLLLTPRNGKVSMLFNDRNIQIRILVSCHLFLFG